MTTYTTYGSAAALGDDCVELTTGPASNRRIGMGGGTLGLDPAFPHSSELEFWKHPARRGRHGLGPSHGGTEVDGYSVLDRAFGVEFDTRTQTELGDIDVDHIAMINHGSYVHTDGPDSFTAGPWPRLWTAEIWKTAKTTSWTSCGTRRS